MQRPSLKVSAWRPAYLLFVFMAALAFGFQTLMMTVISVVGVDLGANPGGAGLLVALFTGIGVISDSLAGSYASRIGVRKSVLIGTGIAVAGLALLVLGGNIAVLALSAALSGVATSFQMTPISGGLSSYAGADQIRAQGTNAMSQRMGALVGALFLDGILAGSGDYQTVFGVLALVVFCLGASCCFLPARADPGRGTGTCELAVGRQPGVLELVRSSRPLRAALVLNIATQLMNIFSSSFFPILLVQLAEPRLLVPCLVGREVMAVLSAAAARWVDNRKFLSVLWATSSLSGAAGIAGGLLVGSPPVVVALFSIHGASVGTGIMLGNASVYYSTDPISRMLGFAAASIVGRLAGWFFPLMFGAAFGLSLYVAVALLLILVVAAVVVYYIFGRAPRSGSRFAVPFET